MCSYVFVCVVYVFVCVVYVFVCVVYVFVCVVYVFRPVWIHFGTENVYREIVCRGAESGFGPR
jgi:hypothetical protein